MFCCSERQKPEFSMPSFIINNCDVQSRYVLLFLCWQSHWIIQMIQNSIPISTFKYVKNHTWWMLTWFKCCQRTCIEPFRWWQRVTRLPGESQPAVTMATMYIARLHLQHFIWIWAAMTPCCMKHWMGVWVDLGVHQNRWLYEHG